MPNGTYDLKTVFHYSKFVLAGVSSLLVLWLFLQTFTESCGGPFPYRTRGPLAKKEYYQLGVLPDWEDVIKVNGQIENNRAEILNRGQAIPPLEFGTPPAGATVRPASPLRPATNEASVD